MDSSDDQVSTPMSKSVSESTAASASTAPSSVVASVDLDKDEEMMVISEAPAAPTTTNGDSSDVEVVSPTSSAKRKAPEAKQPAPKKAKVAATTEHVELKGNKLVLKQKPLDWSPAPSVMMARLDFTNYFKQQIEQDDSFKLTQWPDEHKPVVAHLVQESDKTLPALTTFIKNELAKMLELVIPEAEAPAETDGKKLLTVKARIDSDVLKALIIELATRVNYGLTLEDVTVDLPDGVSELPQTLQLWRWELEEASMYPTEFAAKLEARKDEREKAQKEAVQLFEALDEEQQVQILSKQKLAKPVKAESAAPEASSSSASAGPSAPKKIKSKVADEEKAKVKAEKEAAKAEKEAVKAGKEAQKAAAKAEREAAKAAKEEEKAEKQREREEKQAKKAEEEAEKAERKAERERVKADKTAAEERAKAAQKKQAQMLSGFFIKKSSSPAPAPAGIIATPSTSGSSDFDRVFKPFHIKADVTMAPVNRSPKYGKQPAVSIDSDATLDKASALKQFLADCPRWKRPKYDPYPSPSHSVRQLVQSFNDSFLTGDDTAPILAVLRDPSKVQQKLLKFAEDVRPGYVGTWTKTSKVVTPRTPFGLETALLRYDYDSEAEWDEDDGENGEDVGSDGEEDDEDDSEAESEGSSEGGWMCDDDEIEYMAGFGEEDEMIMDVEGGEDAVIQNSMARQKIIDREKKNKMIRQTNRRATHKGPMLPAVVGLAWETPIGAPTELHKTRIELINDAYFGLDPLKYVSNVLTSTVPATKASTVASASTSKEGAAAVDASASSAAAGAKEKKDKVALPVASHLMADLVRYVGESETLSRDVLLGEVKDKFAQAGESKVTKRSIDRTMKDCKARKVKMGEGKARWTMDEAEVARLSGGATMDTQM